MPRKFTDLQNEGAPLWEQRVAGSIPAAPTTKSIENEKELLNQRANALIHSLRNFPQKAPKFPSWVGNCRKFPDLLYWAAILIFTISWAIFGASPPLQCGYTSCTVLNGELSACATEQIGYVQDMLRAEALTRSKNEVFLRECSTDQVFALGGNKPGYMFKRGEKK